MNWAYLYDEILTIKKEILSFVTTVMDLEAIILSEISKTRNISAMWFHLPVESKNKNRNEHTDIEDKLVAVRKEGQRG